VSDNVTIRDYFSKPKWVGKQNVRGTADTRDKN